MSFTSSSKGVITEEGTTQVGLLEGNIYRTLEYDVSPEDPSYEHNIRVGNFSCFDGENLDIVLNFGEMVNTAVQTINIIDAWSNVTIYSAVSPGSASTSKVSIYFCAQTSGWRIKELS